MLYDYNGGRSGIRTHEGANPLPVFKTGALNHSAILPNHCFIDICGLVRAALSRLAIQIASERHLPLFRSTLARRQRASWPATWLSDPTSLGLAPPAPPVREAARGGRV